MVKALEASEIAQLSARLDAGCSPESALSACSITWDEFIRQKGELLSRIASELREGRLDSHLRYAQAYARATPPVTGAKPSPRQSSNAGPIQPQLNPIDLSDDAIVAITAELQVFPGDVGRILGAYMVTWERYEALRSQLLERTLVDSALAARTEAKFTEYFALHSRRQA